MTKSTEEPLKIRAGAAYMDLEGVILISARYIPGRENFPWELTPVGKSRDQARYFTESGKRSLFGVTVEDLVREVGGLSNPDPSNTPLSERWESLVNASEGILNHTVVTSNPILGLLDGISLNSSSHPIPRGGKSNFAKIPVHQGLVKYFPRALQALAELSAYGARSSEGRGWGTWREVEEPLVTYENAAGRHLFDRETDHDGMDPGSQLPHSLHLAWNWLAVAELELDALERGRPENSSFDAADLDKDPGGVV